MNEIIGMRVNDERCKIRGKTPMIGETSTGCCLSNVVKFTMILAKINTLVSLANSHVHLSLCLSGVFIHDDIRVCKFH